MSKRAVRIVAGLLAGLMALGLVFGLVSDLFLSSANNTSKLNSLKKQLTTATAKKNELKTTLSNLKKDKTELLSQKISIEEQIGLTEQQIEITEGILEELAAEIERRTDELASAKKDEAAQYDMFKTRIRAMYENGGGASELEVILTADSFTQMLSRIETASDIAKYDRRLMERLAQTRAYIEELKTGLEQDEASQKTYKTELLAHEQELAVDKAGLEVLITELEQTIKANEAAFAEADKVEDQFEKDIKNVMAAIEKERAAAAAAAAKKNNTTAVSTKYTGGKMTWPIPGYYTITSEYKMRKHPVTGVYKMHTGIDVGAPKGTKTYAAADGTVVATGFNAAYGNYVLVDHGGGVASLYAHYSKISVSMNQKVTRGKTAIGLVGSTGYSTGNHLHFEVRVNGSHVSPWNYLK